MSDDNAINISPTLQSKLFMEELVKQGKKVYNYGLGQNSVKQPQMYIDLVKKYAHKKEYASCEGVQPLNQVLKTMYNNDQMKYEILVGNGLKELLFVVQSAFKGKIIHVTPSWVSYKEHIDLLERNDDLIQFKTEACDRFRINVDVLDTVLQEIGDDIPKMILINYPSNPTGICYTNDEIESIAAVLKKHNTVVFGDEIYFNLCYNENQKSLADYIPNLVIRGSSVSKDLACGGYRLGWCAFPQTLYPFFAKCCNYASRVYSCAAVPIQYATAELLQNYVLCKSYSEKTKQLYSYIISELKPFLDNNYLEYPGIDAAWYVYLDFEHYRESLSKLGVQDGIQLSQYLMENYHIITVAGQHFSDDGLRLRFALVDFDFDLETEDIQSVNLENMKEGLRVLNNFLDSLEE